MEQQGEGVEEIHVHVALTVYCTLYMYMYTNPTII